MHAQLHVALSTPQRQRRGPLGAALNAARPARQGYMGQQGMGQQGYGEPRMQGYGGGPMEVRRTSAAHLAPAAVPAAGAVHARRAVQGHGVLPTQLCKLSRFDLVCSGSQCAARDASARGAASEQPDHHMAPNLDALPYFCGAGRACAGPCSSARASAGHLALPAHPYADEPCLPGLLCRPLKASARDARAAWAAA